MEIQLIAIGKTTINYVADGIAEFEKRLSHYTTFSIKCLPDIRNTRNISQIQQKEAEGKLLLAEINASDYVILLDEHGVEYTSMQFAAYLQKRMSSGCRRILFIVGGPYGFSEDVYSRANSKMSLSLLTFPHELVRLLYVEQLYRAFTILRNEPYHHE